MKRNSLSNALCYYPPRRTRNMNLGFKIIWKWVLGVLCSEMLAAHVRESVLTKPSGSDVKPQTNTEAQNYFGISHSSGWSYQQCLNCATYTHLWPCSADDATPDISLMRNIVDTSGIGRESRRSSTNPSWVLKVHCQMVLVIFSSSSLWLCTESVQWASTDRSHCVMCCYILPCRCVAL